VSVSIPAATSTGVEPSADLVRVSVATGERVSDLVLPARLPLAEIVPDVAAAVGALDPYEVYGGYQLVQADGRLLDQDASLLAQGVRDGALLSLVAGADAVPAKVYDDIVEAVADAVEASGAGWTEQAARLTLLAVAAVLLSLGALLLFVHRGSGPLVPAVGSVATALLLLTGGVFARKTGDQAAAVVVCGGAAAYAVVAALASVPGLWWTTPLLAAGGVLILVGAVATATVGRAGWVFLPTFVLGAAGVAMGASLTLTRLAPQPELAIVSAVAVVLGSLVPWFALASTRAMPAPLTSAAEIVAAGTPVEAGEVAARVARAHQITLGLALSIGALVAIAAPHVAPLGWAGLGLVWAAGVVQIMRTRQCVLAQDVAVGIASGTVGIIVGTVAAVLAHPEWAGVVASVGAVVAVGVLAALGLPKRATVRSGQLMDLLEATALLTLVPLLLVAIGLLGGRP
jgi:type VII secretion integral membrane protein EccD